MPEENRIELRRARTFAELATENTGDVWHEPETGPYGELPWAPEPHFNHGAWYAYLGREIKQLVPAPHVCHSQCAPKPLLGEWEFLGQVDSGIDSFRLDATTFTRKGQRYYSWTQKDEAIGGNSKLCIAPTVTPWRLGGAPVMLSKPEFDLEVRGLSVNERPFVIQRNGKTRAPSLHRGLVRPVRDAGLSRPYFRSSATRCGIPTVTYVKPLQWDDDGMPLFGRPSLA